jgi:nucleoside-diphosphate-sugar epimerase
MNILLTGFTGNLGMEIARQLAPHRVLALTRDGQCAEQMDNVEVVEGTLEHLPKTIASEVEVIVHSAASTAFRAPIEDLRRVNVDGTLHLLEFAKACPRLCRFLHLSTTCVCGDRTGIIPEAPIAKPSRFVNAYEQSKWEAEQVVLASHLPVEVARLSIVAGSEIDGSVRRPGALHHTLYWLYKGLILMLPGRADSPVDLISTEFAARAVAALTAANAVPGRIVHVSSGEAAPQLGELLRFLANLFAQTNRGWASGAISLPEIADAHTFTLFQDSARQSGDVLFQRVCEDAESFLPGLLHPRTLATTFARRIPSTDWRVLTERVFTWLLANDWGRQPRTPTPSDAHA